MPGKREKVGNHSRSVCYHGAANDDETTATKLRDLITERATRCQVVNITLSNTLDLTFRESTFCHMIREANKDMHLTWTQQYRHEAEHRFLDVVYTDETFIQLESPRRFCFRKQEEQPRPKSRLVACYVLVAILLQLAVVSCLILARYVLLKCLLLGKHITLELYTAFTCSSACTVVQLNNR